MSILKKLQKILRMNLLGSYSISGTQNICWLSAGSFQSFLKQPRSRILHTQEYNTVIKPCLLHSTHLSSGIIYLLSNDSSSEPERNVFSSQPTSLCLRL